MTDPTLERIWEVRRQIFAQCGNDPLKLVQYYIELQKLNPERLLKPELDAAGEDSFATEPRLAHVQYAAGELAV